MGAQKPSYEELEARLAEAERALNAIRDGQVDVLIGEEGVYQVRLKNLEHALARRKALSKKLVELLEKERWEMASAVHDHAGQLLTALTIDLDSLKNELPPGPLMEKAFLVEKRASKLMGFLRHISRNLRPPALESLGLIPSIQRLGSGLNEQTGIEMQLYIKDIPARLHPDQELAIYRIVQESLNNVAKHANAEKVFLSLILRDGKIHVAVEDNGAGFERQEILNTFGSHKKSLGLRLMKERANQLGGDLWVDSKKGKGTAVLAEIPLNVAGGSEERLSESELEGLM